MKLDELHLHWRSCSFKGKKYYSYSLAKSVWKDGSCRKIIAVKLGKLTDKEVAYWKKTLADAKAQAKSKGGQKEASKSSDKSLSELTRSNSRIHTTRLISENESTQDDLAVKKFLYTDVDRNCDIQSYDEMIGQAFEDVLDPREEDNRSYPFYGLLLTILAATLAGSSSISAIFEYVKEKFYLYRPLLNIKSCPSYMAFWWILTRTKSDELNEAFMRWIRTIADNLEGDSAGSVIALDGKTIRGAKNSHIHFVSAYDSTRGLLLGQKKTEKKSNEITAIPELLKVIDIKNATVTIDAMGCQKEIVRKIREHGGHYIIALKGNQETLHEEAKNFFTQARDVNFKGASCRRYSSSNKGHGRQETREVVITQNLKWLDCRSDWKDLKALIEVKSTREIKGVTTVEHRYYISSRSMKAEIAHDAIRDHWGVENNLHWVMDVMFDDDKCRANTGHAGENLALFRRMAYCLMKQETVKGRGLASIRRKAMWNESFVLELLAKFIKNALYGEK